MSMRIWMVGLGLCCALSLGVGCGGSQNAELDTSETSGETGGETNEDPGTTCQPSTCAELNATCGSIDDGCGTSIECGTCEGTEGQCVDNQCECIPDCDGKDCGFDGCNGFCDRECVTCDRKKLCVKCVTMCVALGHTVEKPTLPAEQERSSKYPASTSSSNSQPCSHSYHSRVSSQGSRATFHVCVTSAIGGRLEAGSNWRSFR